MSDWWLANKSPERRRLSPPASAFVASFLGLFLELALIRWVSAEVRIFAYCKNLVLVASFLGFGTGCLLWRRRAHTPSAMFLLLVLALLIRLPWPVLTEYGPRGVTNVLSELSGFMVFRDVERGTSWDTYAGLAFAVGWTTALFFLIALVMVPFGQATARGIARLANPLHGYSINVAGSLAGILGYTLVTSISLPPLHWFVPVTFGSAAMTDQRQLLLPVDGPNVRETWSSYQPGLFTD